MSVLLKQGQEVEAKPARPVTVYSLSLQDFSPPYFTIGLSFICYIWKYIIWYILMNGKCVFLYNFIKTVF